MPTCPRAVVVAALGLLVTVLAFAPARPVAAHPLGLPAFARIAANPDGTATVTWNAAADDVAVLARELGVDVPDGGVLSREQDAEVSASPALAPLLADGIVLAQDGAPCRPAVEVTSLVEAGATVRFTCPRPVEEVRVRVTLLHDVDERYRTLGIAGTPEGTERVMFTASAPEHDLVLDPDSADLLTGASAAAVDAEPTTTQPFGGSLPFESTFVALIDRSAGPGGLLLGLLVALGVGAAHGLAPGHGKAIAAAYLVGDRGRPRDAVALGGVVALMHTWSVLALGFALYSATQRPATVLLSAWLQLVAGLIVAGLGGWLVIRRLRERRADAGAHDHDHDHTHVADGGPHPLSWQGLVALGAAGGILPSPSALLVLFTALAVGRLAYGLGLIAAFSVGLAVTVSVVGLAVLRGRDLLRDRAAPQGRLPAVLHALPLLGAGGVAVLGIILAVRAGMAVAGA